MKLPLAACALAALLLPTATHAADTPAVAVVRQFLAARAARHSVQAYALLSFQGMQDPAGGVFKLTEKQYAAANPLPDDISPKSAPALFAVTVLLLDTHNLQHYTFTVAGLDPNTPGAVLVRAYPPGKSPASPPVLPHLVVSAAGAPRLDFAKSMQSNAPKLSENAMQQIDVMRSQNQLKYIAVAIDRYMQLHNEHFPDAANWGEEITPFLPNKTYFRDPTAPPGQLYGYAYNRTLSGVPLSALTASPDSIVMVFESTKNQKDAADTGGSVPHPGRHKGGTNYLFAGGRVDWFPDGTVFSYRLDGKKAAPDTHI